MFRTLLVEDCPGYRSTLHSLLHEHFPLMVILEAETGDDALAVTASYHPDLVLMDIKLPGGDNGLILTHKLKNAGSKARVVILTSYDFPEYREAAFANGASDFLCKETASPGDILSLVRQTLDEQTPT